MNASIAWASGNHSFDAGLEGGQVYRRVEAERDDDINTYIFHDSCCRAHGLLRRRTGGRRPLSVGRFSGRADREQSVSLN